MAVVSPQQIAQYASQAGFRGNALVMAIAISLAESGGNTTATNHNSNGSTDYGLWQINSSHSQYNPTLLLSNPAYNAQAAFQLSSNGSNWRPWCTAYSDGACGSRGGSFLGSGSPYQRYMSQATAAVAGGTVQQPVQATPWVPDFLKNLDSANYGMWNSPTPGLTLSGQVQPGEGGVDISVPIGTPVLAIASGNIVGAGYYPDSAHGVITTRVEVPGAGIQDLYYQHIQLDPSIMQCHNYGGKDCTQSVTRGQRIGTIGPFNEIEMGFNSLWGGIWGGNYKDPSSHPGPWIRDPRPWIKAILNGGGASPAGSGLFGTSGGPYVPLTYTTLTSQVHNTLINTPGFYGIALAVDESEQFPGWVNLAEGITDFQGMARSIGATISDNFMPFIIRSGLVVVGSTLLILLIMKPIEGIGRMVA